jgi:hypothetical protein
MDVCALAYGLAYGTEKAPLGERRKVPLTCVGLTVSDSRTYA